jgi:hypothetical protein
MNSDDIRGDDPLLAEIRDLAREADPPRRLESRIVGALRERGLVRASAAGRAPRWIAAAALLVIAFVLGRASVRPASVAASDLPRFALLLYEGPGGNGAGEEARVSEYRRWAGDLRDQGHVVDGEKLAEDVPVAIGSAAGRLATLPSLQGFFIVSALDEAEARRIAAGHPHVLHGGTIVLRRVEDLPPRS